MGEMVDRVVTPWPKRAGISEGKLLSALLVVGSYVDDPTVTPWARLYMIRHWANEALEGRAVPAEAGISGPG